MSIKLKGSSDGSVSFDAPADTSPSGSDITLTLPTSAGSANQFLKNSGIAGELEYSSLVEDSSGDVGLGIAAPTWTSGGGLHLGDNHGIGFGDGGNGRPDFQLITTDGSRLDFRCGFGADDADISIDTSGRLLVGTTTPGSTAGEQLTIAGSSNAGMTIRSSTSAAGSILFEDTASDRGEIQYSHNGDYMRFKTAGSERMRIASDGTAFIKSTSHGLETYTSQGAGTSKYVYRGSHTSGATVVFNVWSNGNVESATNSYTGISDVKLKENIVDANSQWDDLKAIQVRNYNFKEETGQETYRQIGVVAQELEAVSPGLVIDIADVDDEGNDLGTVTKTVNYSVLYMKAVKALQEAIAKIETLETKVAALEAA